MRKTYRQTFLFFFLFFFVVTSWAATSLEELLKESDLAYLKRESGTFYLPISVGGETVSFYLREQNFTDSDETRLVYMYSIIDKRDEVAPPALYKKVAEINESILIGKVGISKDGRSVYYITSFWLNEADQKTLGKEIAVAFRATLDLKEILSQF